MPINQRIDLLIAVSTIIARGAAGIVLVEILVRVVEPVLTDHHANSEVLANHLGEPVGCIDHLELGVDIDLLQLTSYEHGRVTGRAMLRAETLIASRLSGP